MLDYLRLAHLQRLRHPVEEADEVAPDVEIDKSEEPIRGLSRRGPGAVDVALRVVNSGVDGLNSQHSEGEEEDDSAENVDEG